MIPEKLDEALQVAGAITPILADGARGNPPQIKRFVNTMGLRLAIAEERGFGTDLKPPILAKLMLVERFAPDKFEAIARDSVNDGRSKMLAALEAAEAEAADEHETLEIAWAKRWAKREPKLATIDLRPYVFISRDRRATLGTPINRPSGDAD